ncbi:MAG: metallophosphoesterase [Nitrospirae bacterium]|nr:MAG: metallophosphoesterase [Nitrospirota bacterium]
MTAGILSDSHDHMDNLKKALDIFEARGVEHIIHAGDFSSPFTRRVLKNFKGGITAVFGNNDGERLLLRKLYGDAIHTQPHKFTLNEKRIVLMHEPDVVDALADSGHFDLVVFGHTHEPVIKKIKNTLVINPGETCGWLYGKPTVAVVNLNTMDAEIVPLS